MRAETKELLAEYIEECLNSPGFKSGQCECVGVGVSDEIIKKMEDELGLKFSDDYIEFLRDYGEIDLYGLYPIYGYASDSMHYGEMKSVVDLTMFYRNQDLPYLSDWYIMTYYPTGTPIGCKPDGTVWILYFKRVYKEKKLADSFDDFLYTVLNGDFYED